MLKLFKVRLIIVRVNVRSTLAVSEGTGYPRGNCGLL
jgi:hypothetical protein